MPTRESEMHYWTIRSKESWSLRIRKEELSSAVLSIISSLIYQGNVCRVRRPGTLILDFQQLEIYTFASAASHFNNPRLLRDPSSKAAVS